MVESSPSPEALEVAAALARRASADLQALEKLAPDPKMDEGILGFHAQQAVEKSLKVALVLGGVDFPKTHDIDFLVALAVRNAIDIAAEVAEAGWLTPWAAELRYDDLPLESLERDLAVAVAETAVVWCRQLLEAAGG